MTDDFNHNSFSEIEVFKIQLNRYLKHKAQLSDFLKIKICRLEKYK